MSKLGRTGLGVLSLAGLLLAAPAADASDYSGDIGLLGGAVMQDENLSGVPDQGLGDVSAVLGGRLGFLLSNRVGLFLDGTHSWINAPHSGETGTLDFRGGLELYGPEVWSGAPLFLTLAGGLEHVSFDGPTDEDALTRPMAAAGIGQRIALGPVFARWELRAIHAFEKSDDAKPAAPDLGDAFLHPGLLVGLSIPFGGSDTDRDGVRDRNDKCPDTPTGAMVDLRGCGLDGDGDGVFDGLDRCADTPAGWPVDTSGCPTDKDGDGVADGADRCPGTAEGAKVDAQGCAVDSDGDGVPDGLDRCDGTQKGAQVDANGCAIDADGDGVADGVDRCPNTPAGTKVDERGCPILFEPERTELVLEGVTFESNSEKLRPESYEALDRVAASLAAWPEVRIEVGGHTDSRGSAEHNQDLSRRRAETVRLYLATHGVEASRMTVNGYGETEPVADNDTAEGRALNRRVTLRRR